MPKGMGYSKPSKTLKMKNVGMASGLSAPNATKGGMMGKKGMGKSMMGGKKYMGKSRKM